MSVSPSTTQPGNDQPYHTALSIDDPWYDNETLWSYGECGAINELVETVNRTQIDIGHLYSLRILGNKEAEGLTGGILLRASIEHFGEQIQLQILADTLCRLIRPSRYICNETAPKGRRPVVYGTVFHGEDASAHERIEAKFAIVDRARDLGRTEEGIEAALAELSNWNLTLGHQQLPKHAAGASGR